MAQAKPQRKVRTRRSYSEEFKQVAVQLLLDGHSAPSAVERLGLTGPNVLYSWKKDLGNSRMRVSCCLAHARRKFEEAKSSYSKLAAEARACFQQP